jgi:hypothetical protein
LANPVTETVLYNFLTTDGTKEIVIDLKNWALCHGYNYHTLINNSKLLKPVRWGKLTGFRVINISVS